MCVCLLNIEMYVLLLLSCVARLAQTSLPDCRQNNWLKGRGGIRKNPVILLVLIYVSYWLTPRNFDVID